MTKITSKLLTLLLAFAMVFTSIGWLGSFEVNAAEGDDSLIVKVVDGDGQPVAGVKLVINGVEEGQTNYTFDGEYVDGKMEDGISDENGMLEWDYSSEGELMPGDSFYLAVGGESPYVCDPISVVFGDDIYISTVGGVAYSQDSPYVITLDQVWTTDFNFNTDTSYNWAEYGIDYTSVDFDKDLIVDVRSVDFSKDPHFVFSDPDAVDVTKADIVAGDAVAQKLDTALNKAKKANKKVVLICYGGMKYAKRAMQYYNSIGESLGPDGNVTYLKGGANNVLENAFKDYKANLGIGFDEITSNDVILDVRSKENFDKGHLPGAIHVDVTDEDGKLSDKDKSDMVAALAKVPNGARLVIVCNSGKSLAYKAMAYFMADKSAAGLENLKKVSYLIGGDTAVPADKKVTTAQENTPAPASSIKDGQTAVVNGSTVKVTSASAKTAEYVKAPNKKSVTVPATVAVNGQTLKVTQIAAKAFTGKKIKTVTVGANVTKIAPNAFKGSKATKMIVKTKGLTKASVKGSLKGSKIKTVQVKVGKKKDNKKFVKKYKKFFTKKNAGKKAKVK